MVEISNDALGNSVSALSRKLGHMVLLSAAEIDFLEGMQTNVAEVEAGKTFVEEGSEYLATFIIRSGWAAREKSLKDGRRQVMSFALPGDFVGLHINFRRVATYDVTAISDLEVALVEPSRILEVHQNFPILASGLSWSTVREYNLLGEQAVRLGRKSASERLCHLILELYHRLELVRLAGVNAIEFPLRQADVADALGLSAVHTNRTFRELKKKELIDYNQDQIVLRDIEKMASLAEFDSTYLSGFDFGADMESASLAS